MNIFNVHAVRRVDCGLVVYMMVSHLGSGYYYV